MKQHAIKLQHSGNEEYFVILEQHNAIIEEYDRLNMLIMRHRVPKVFLFRQKEKIIALGQQLKTLQDRFIQWDKGISHFLVHPKLFFIEDVDHTTAFYHYMSVLRDIRNTGDACFERITTNYHKVFGEYESQVNFVIAIASFFASFVGLIVALSTLK